MDNEQKVVDWIEACVESFPDCAKNEVDQIISKKGGISGMEMHIHLIVKAYLYKRMLDSFEETEDIVGTHKNIYAFLDQTVESAGVGLTK